MAHQASRLSCPSRQPPAPLQVKFRTEDCFQAALLPHESILDAIICPHLKIWEAGAHLVVFGVACVLPAQQEAGAPTDRPRDAAAVLLNEICGLVAEQGVQSPRDDKAFALQALGMTLGVRLQQQMAVLSAHEVSVVGHIMPHASANKKR